MEDWTTHYCTRACDRDRDRDRAMPKCKKNLDRDAFVIVPGQKLIIFFSPKAVTITITIMARIWHGSVTILV